MWYSKDMNKVFPTEQLPKSIQEMAQAFPIMTYLRSAEDGGFWVESPQLGGCFASGDTPAEAMHNYKFAIFEYFDVPKKYQNPANFQIQVADLPEPKVTRKPFIAKLISTGDLAYA